MQLKAERQRYKDSVEQINELSRRLRIATGVNPAKVLSRIISHISYSKSMHYYSAYVGLICCVDDGYGGFRGAFDDQEGLLHRSVRGARQNTRAPQVWFAFRFHLPFSQASILMIVFSWEVIMVVIIIMIMIFLERKLTRTQSQAELDTRINVFEKLRDVPHLSLILSLSSFLSCSRY